MCEIITAKSAGFCFGVERALNTVYEQIGKNEPIYTFGPIIHNEEVVNELKEKGVGIINTLEELPKVKKGTVIIRSHGISKDVHEKIAHSGMELVDATCPFVKRIHKIVEEESKKNKQIIIIGNPNHPEVIGINGWADNAAIIINNEDEALNTPIDLDKDTIIVAQTTFNYNKLKDLVEIITKRNYNVSYMDTVCHATSERQSEAVKIAEDADAMIVIGSYNSSNTQKLFEMCKQKCDDTFYVQTVSDLDIRKLYGKKRIGITAGASTPKKIIQEVQTHVRAQFSGNARRVDQINS